MSLSWFVERKAAGGGYAPLADQPPTGFASPRHVLTWLLGRGLVRRAGTYPDGTDILVGWGDEFCAKLRETRVRPSPLKHPRPQAGGRHLTLVSSNPPCDPPTLAQARASLRYLKQCLDDDHSDHHLRQIELFLDTHQEQP